MSAIKTEGRTNGAPMPDHDNKGFSEEKCVRCGWVMGREPLNCNNDNTPHRFPSQVLVDAYDAAVDRIEALERALQPFSDAAVRSDEYNPEGHPHRTSVSVAMLREARLALTHTPKEPT